MFQSLTAAFVAVLLCVALSGCGRQDTTPTTTTTTDAPTADVPILVTPEE